MPPSLIGIHGSNNNTEKVILLHHHRWYRQLLGTSSWSNWYGTPQCTAQARISSSCGSRRMIYSETRHRKWKLICIRTSRQRQLGNRSNCRRWHESEASLKLRTLTRLIATRQHTRSHKIKEKFRNVFTCWNNLWCHWGFPQWHAVHAKRRFSRHSSSNNDIVPSASEAVQCCGVNN